MFGMGTGDPFAHGHRQSDTKAVRPRCRFALSGEPERKNWFTDSNKLRAVLYAAPWTIVHESCSRTTNRTSERRVVGGRALTVSTARLKTLLPLHLRPINLVVYQGS